MMDILSTKEIIKHATLQWDSQANKKNAVSISFAFTIGNLIRNENIKNCLK